MATKSMAASAGTFSGTKKRPRILWMSLNAFPGLAVSAAVASSTSVAKRVGTGPSRMSPSKTSVVRCHSCRRTVEVVSLYNHEVSGYLVGKLRLGKLLWLEALGLRPQPGFKGTVLVQSDFCAIFPSRNIYFFFPFSIPPPPCCLSH